MRKFCFIMIVLLIAYVPTMAADNAFTASINMKIHFYEFQVVTYAPITLDGIMNTSDYKIDFYEGHNFIKYLKQALTKSKANKHFDKKNVRLRVEIMDGKKNKVYGVDSSGVVMIENSEKLYQLSKNDMETIQNSIISFHGIVDRKPDFKPDGPLSK